jgi:predicted amidohydrolase
MRAHWAPDEPGACSTAGLAYETDTTWTSGGDTPWRTFDTEAGSFVVGGCMDLNDPRFLLWLRSTRPRALAFPTNWIDQDVGPWDYWKEVLEVSDCGSALVAANTYGSEDDVHFRGERAILDGGVLLTTAPRVGDALLRRELGPGAPGGVSGGAR